MTSETQAAVDLAADTVRRAGFTPCASSAFVADGRAFAFSVESASGRSISGPAFSVVVDAETGAVTTTGEPRARRAS